MFSFVKRYKELLIISALLLWPLLSYLSFGHRGRAPNFVDRAVLWVSQPVQSALTSVVAGVTGVANGYIALRGAHEEAAECRVSLSEARAENNALKEAQAENLRLKAMLGYVEASIDQEIVARVIGLNPSPQFQSVRIDRGEDDGVRVGMPVVTPDGVVGQVVRAVGSSADVMLITDPASKIGGVTQRARVRATVSGTGDGHRLSLEYVRREDDVKDGDELVTAGSDGIFPRGLRIGTVKSPQRLALGVWLKANLEPSVDLSRIEDVLVIPVSMGIGSFSMEQKR